MKFLPELLCLCFLFEDTFCNEEGRAPGSTHGDRVLHKYMGMIPNTGPDGIVTKALAALSGLSGELAQNSGVNNPFGDSKEGNSGSPNVGLIVGLVCLALFVGVGVGVLIAVLALKGYIPLKRNEAESPAEKTGVARPLRDL